MLSRAGEAMPRGARDIEFFFLGADRVAVPVSDEIVEHILEDFRPQPNEWGPTRKLVSYD